MRARLRRAGVAAAASPWLYSVSLVECDAPLSTVSLEGQVLEATPATFSRL